MAGFVASAGLVLSLDGLEVRGIEQYRFATGAPRDVVHRPLDADNPTVLPGQTDFGQVTLQMYRNTTDPGQARMWEAYTQRQMMAATLETPVGPPWLFTCFVRAFPAEGTLKGVKLASAVLRISGSVVEGS